MTYFGGRNTFFPKTLNGYLSNLQGECIGVGAVPHRRGHSTTLKPVPLSWGHTYHQKCCLSLGLMLGKLTTSFARRSYNKTSSKNRITSAEWRTPLVFSYRGLRWCHCRESGSPVIRIVFNPLEFWIPAYAGMTRKRNSGFLLAQE